MKNDTSSSTSLSIFVRHLPSRPYCTDDLSAGLQIRARPMAMQRAYIQPNGPGMVWALVFDIDRPIVDQNRLATVWDDGGLPPPNFATLNRDGGRGHIVYMLSAGVCTTAAAHLKPLRYVAAVQRGMCAALGADAGYAGLITKNPLHPRWRVWEIHGHSIELGVLAEYLDLDAANARQYRLPDTDTSGLGRNCTLYEQGRAWAYSAIREYWAPDGLPRWSERVLERLCAINGQFPEPLPLSEVRATAKSIARWTWTRITPGGLQELIQRTHTPEQQAERGRKAAKKDKAAAGIASGNARRVPREQERATARLMRAQGMTYRAIAATLGIPYQTVARWLA